MVVELLDPKPGERIWDMCAAPGGKTSLIDWLTAHQAKILATELSARKATLLRQRLEQSPSIAVHEADAAIYFAQMSLTIKSYWMHRVVHWVS